MARETWYVLEDGTAVDPNEVSADEAGVLFHTSGAAVAIGEHGNPLSKGIDVEEMEAMATKKAEAAAKAKKPATPPAKDMKPGQAPSMAYKTRDANKAS